MLPLHKTNLRRNRADLTLTPPPSSLVSTSPVDTGRQIPDQVVALWNANLAVCLQMTAWWGQKTLPHLQIKEISKQIPKAGWVAVRWQSFQILLGDGVFLYGPVSCWTGAAFSWISQLQRMVGWTDCSSGIQLADEDIIIWVAGCKVLPARAQSPELLLQPLEMGFSRCLTEHSCPGPSVVSHCHSSGYPPANPEGHRPPRGPVWAKSMWHPDFQRDTGSTQP